MAAPKSAGQRVRELKAAGRTYSEIGVITGVSRDTVRRAAEGKRTRLDDRIPALKAAARRAPRPASQASPYQPGPKVGEPRQVAPGITETRLGPERGRRFRGEANVTPLQSALLRAGPEKRVRFQVMLANVSMSGKMHRRFLVHVPPKGSFHARGVGTQMRQEGANDWLLAEAIDALPYPPDNRDEITLIEWEAHLV